MRLNICKQTGSIKRRNNGGLIGSSLAGVKGRVPILDVVTARNIVGEIVDANGSKSP